VSNPYIGEIRMFAGNFAPEGWLFCDGALVSIDDYDTLYNLVGTTYGGDGQTTFALPDLRGRLPVHMGQGRGLSNLVLGETGGLESVTLTPSQVPSHTHALTGSTSAATSTSPTNAVWGAWSDGQYATAPTDGARLAADALTPVGGSQPHENMPPFLVVNFIISLYGIYPSQS
jgi:microcystin-dependent protein